MDVNRSHREEEGSSNLHHELRDVKARPVVIFCVALVVIIAAAFWISRLMFDYFASHQATTLSSPLVDQRPRTPPEPRLQLTPVQNREAIRAAEDNLLNSYGWVDRQSGIVRIPIDQAMKLLVERGLPSRPEAVASHGGSQSLESLAGGSTTKTKQSLKDSSSGRSVGGQDR